MRYNEKEGKDLVKNQKGKRDLPIFGQVHICG